MYLNIYQNGANHYFGLIDLLANVKQGDNHITFLLLYGFVKKSVLLNNKY